LNFGERINNKRSRTLASKEENRMGKAVDVIQVFGSGKLDRPEVRVWCHPRRVDESGDDYYMLFSCETTSVDSIFKALTRARRYIKRHEEAESEPLIAYDGNEFTEEEFWKYNESKNQKSKETSYEK
jgi:thiamine monophosphate kinase